MNKEQIIDDTLGMLATHTKFKADFQHKIKVVENGYDGELQFRYPKNLPRFKLAVKNELRNYQIPQLIQQAKKYQPFMLMAANIFPLLKEELRANKINYVDGAGNIFIQFKEQLIWIEGNKPATIKKAGTNRAFTKTGLKAVFYLLKNKDAIDYTYRQLADVADIAIGNIKYIIDGLEEAGYILPLNNKTLTLQNKRELLDRWITAYGETLKPGLLLKAYNFWDKTKFDKWQELEFNNKETAWGGEPAGDLLTNYLKPETLELYTNEHIKLTKDWTLIPNEKGVLKVYKKFWKDDEESAKNYADPLLVYADLILTNDPRCQETANKIFEKYLKNELI